MDDDWEDGLLRFWLVGLGPGAWFTRSAATDALVADRYARLPERVAVACPPGSALSPQSALAAAIALDQLPRNLHRGSAQAFAYDAQALAIAADAIARGFDAGLAPERRLFLYLPFEHSEDPGMQARSVALFTALGHAEWLDYALRHKAVIDRFGRFPLRNTALGRVSTPAEIAFLAEPGSGF